MTNAGITTSLPELIQLRFAAQKLQLQLPRHAKQRLSGNCHSTIRGRGLDFDEVRHYQSGDDLRAMDWKVTARTGTPHIKLYHEERELPIFFLVDYNPSMFFATRVAYKSVIVAKVTALLAWVGALQGERIGGLIFSGKKSHEILPRARQEGVLTLLKALADVKKPWDLSPTSMARHFTRVQKILRPASLIFIASDFSHFDDPAREALHSLAQHYQLILLPIYDPLEAALPPPNHYGVTDGNTTLTVNTYDQQFRQTYEDQFTAKLETLKQFCHQHRVPCWPLATQDDLIRQLGIRLHANYTQSTTATA